MKSVVYGTSTSSIRTLHARWAGRYSTGIVECKQFSASYVIIPRSADWAKCHDCKRHNSFYQISMNIIWGNLKANTPADSAQSVEPEEGTGSVMSDWLRLQGRWGGSVPSPVEVGFVLAEELAWRISFMCTF